MDNALCILGRGEVIQICVAANRDFHKKIYLPKVVDLDEQDKSKQEQRV